MKNPIEIEQRDDQRMLSESFDRGAQVKVSDIDPATRTVTLSFGSEFEVERWYGVEKIEMSARAADLKRLNNGGALLSDHYTDKQIGVVRKAWIGEDKRAYATVQFSQRATAQEEFQDVVDGIRTNVSFRYKVLDYKTEKGQGNAPDRRTVTRWEGLEISLVSIPADPGVGVGRELQVDGVETPAPDATTEAVNDQRQADEVEQTIEKRGITMTDEEKRAQEAANAASQPAPAVVTFAREDGIFEYGRKFGIDPNVVKRHAFNPAGTVESLRDEVAKQYVEAPQTPGTTEAPAARLDLSDKEVRQYSISRAIVAQADGDWRGAEFERECHDEIAARMDKNKMQRAGNGFLVPTEIQGQRNINPAMVEQLKRDLSVSGGGAAGAYLVSTDHMPQSFIDILRSRTVMVSKAGVQVMSDLVGNPSIPRQDGAATGYWVNEGAPPPESQLTLGQLPMSPKTCGAMTEFTRQLLIQSAPSIDQLVKSDIAAVLARTIDLAIIDGTGVSGQPTGILRTTGVDEITLSGAGSTFDWSDAVEFETAIAEANAADGTMWITRPSVKGVLKTRPKIGTTFPVYLVGEDNDLNGYPVVTTTQFPAASMIFGDCSTVILGEWGILEIEANKFGTGFAAGNIQVRGLHMVDVAVRYPQAIKKTTAFL